MKFKVGDKVKIISYEDNEALIGCTGSIIQVDIHDPEIPYKVYLQDDYWWISEEDLVLILWSADTLEKFSIKELELELAKRKDTTGLIDKGWYWIEYDGVYVWYKKGSFTLRLDPEGEELTLWESIAAPGIRKVDFTDLHDLEDAEKFLSLAKKFNVKIT